MPKLETVQKVTSYVTNTCKEINDDLENIDVEDLIDFGAMLNVIHKQADTVSSAIKKVLLSEEIITKKKIEVEGTHYRARYAERENAFIDPKVLMAEVDIEDFYACIKVGMKEVKEKLDENKIKSLKTVNEPTQQVSFQKKG